MQTSNVVITSEDEAFSYIEKYLADGIAPENISFEGWPSLVFRLTGDKFDQSLTPSIMKGFVEMQSQINKSFALAKYGTPDTKRLSKEERNSLEIQVKVEKGSSIIEVNFGDFIDKFATTLGGKMTGEQIVILALGAATIWAGTTAFKAYLTYRKDKRQDEVKSESEREHLKTMQFMSEQETKRTEVLAKLIDKSPQLQNMRVYSEEAKAEMIKSFSKANTAEVDGLVLDSELSKELATNARRRSAEIRMDGYYRIEQVDSTDPEAFKVRIKNVDNGVRINAVVQNVFLEYEGYKEALKQAEWERESVHLTINAKEMDGEIKSATIIYVGGPPSLS